MRSLEAGIRLYRTVYLAAFMIIGAIIIAFGITTLAQLANANTQLQQQTNQAKVDKQELETKIEKQNTDILNYVHCLEVNSSGQPTNSLLNQCATSQLTTPIVSPATPDQTPAAAQISTPQPSSQPSTQTPMSHNNSGNTNQNPSPQPPPPHPSLLQQILHKIGL